METLLETMYSVEKSAAVISFFNERDWERIDEISSAHHFLIDVPVISR